jgi:hypothetical protein
MSKREMRNSQAVIPFGVGAIVDFPDESLMTCSIDYWSKKGERILDNRLSKRLSGYGIKYFRKPPTEIEGDIPFVRFPRWMFCPKCRKFQPIEEWKKEYKERKNKIFDTPRCSIDNIKLVPSRFIVACTSGHIDDFPWVEWVHKNRSICDKPKLKFYTSKQDSGLRSINIRCDNCRASQNMSGAFNQNALDDIKTCRGFKPWELGETENCNKSLQTLQRGGSNVYFPNIVNSIYLPEDFSDLEQEIKNTRIWKKFISSDHGGVVDVEFISGYISEELHKDQDKIINCINKIMNKEKNSDNDNIISEEMYRYNEYQAFLKKNNYNIDSKDFIIETIKGSEYNLNFIEKVVLVHKLKETKALLSFTRIKPNDSEEFVNEDEDKKKDLEPQYVSEDLRNKGWLPAIEYNGEGIFFKINSEMIDEWLENDKITKRANKINGRYKEVVLKRGGSKRNITPKYLLLHTFAHLLIRQLTYECGYSSAALKERIYCNKTKNKNRMEGILIYTASGDTDGTLGGLVREGRPDYLPSIIDSAIKNTEWCSQDPLCIESEGQGLDSLNLAACHACTLLPETSCEERNRFLDRGLLFGTIDNRELGFFNNFEL